MKATQITYLEPNKVVLTEINQEMADNKVLVKTAFSTLSCGTERANLTASVNTSQKFPMASGYSSAGIVEAVGKDVTSVKPGDRVVVYWGCHQNYNLQPEERVVKIEHDNISLSEAALSFVATFPTAAIRKVKLELGESLMVMGLGILGQIAVKLARVAGAVPIIAADPVAERREEALKNGADYAFDPFEPDFAQKVKEVTGGGVNTAIEVTGVGAGLDETLDCMAKFGRVALLGCTRDKNFNIDYYQKVHVPGITLVGAHTNARPMIESYPGYHTHRDDIRDVLKLCATGRLSLIDMIKEYYSPNECVDVYERLIADRNFPPVVQFDWSRLE